jgi:glutamate N-acetyltransferase/amino-acid N-acetyltransferase
MTPFLEVIRYDEAMSKMSSSLPQSAVPLGFRFAAVRAGIKPSGKPDLACIVTDTDEAASAAALFTSNRVVAAPVTVGRAHLSSNGGRVRAVVVNSGNANCATGALGLATCEQVCAAAAAQFTCTAEEVFPSSTGIIGVPLPGEKLVAALPAAAAALGATADHFRIFANAILTTDTCAKIAHSTVEIDGQAVRILGACKGAGMIHPQLVPHATMLVYLLTDAAIESAALARLLGEAGEVSFNRISIDGDTSTNDTVLLLASGASGVAVRADDTSFQSALTEVCTSLAKQIVDDGEGVTHVVTLEIEGAPTDAGALRVAKSIAHSPLVKTAWAGNDPNWGRLVAAIGYSGVEIDPERIDIWFGALPICAGGGRSPDYDERAAHALLLEREFTIRVALGVGAGSCRFWTTDLTAEYIHINAAYST